MKKMIKKLVSLVGLLFLAGFTSCDKTQSNLPQLAGVGAVATQRALTEAELEKMSKDEIVNFLKQKSAAPDSPANSIVDMKKSLSFTVRNKTGATFYCCCFHYIKNKLIGRWRWEKSKVYKVVPGNAKLIVVGESVDAERERNSVFGYLAVFSDKKEADSAIIEIMDERKLLDLDLLCKIKNKEVVINVKKYGIKGKRLAYTARSKEALKGEAKILDFLVENQTGRDLFLTCFVYEQPESTQSFDLWKYDKTDILELKNGGKAYLKIPPVYDRYKWSYMRGVLGIFDSENEQKANDSTFEIVSPSNKLELGELTKLIGQKIILSVENYGIDGDFIDYVVKPAMFVNKAKIRRAKGKINRA